VRALTEYCQVNTAGATRGSLKDYQPDSHTMLDSWLLLFLSNEQQHTTNTRRPRPPNLGFPAAASTCCID
jgi:hypothetical protein